MRFRFPGPRFGIVLGVERLAQVAGADAARDLLLRGHVLTCGEALALGLLTARMTPDRAMAEVDALGQRVAELEDVTVRAILAATRGDGGADHARLVASASRAGMAERVRAYARAIEAQRAAARY